MKRTWTLPRVPVPANRVLRSHWSERSRQRKLWTVEVLAAAGGGPWRMLRRRDRRRVRVRLTVRRRRLQDPDNAVASCKPLVDALVRAGWLVDDSRRWFELEVVEQLCANGEQRTVVEWEVAMVATEAAPHSRGDGGEG